MITLQLFAKIGKTKQDSGRLQLFTALAKVHFGVTGDLDPNTMLSLPTKQRTLNIGYWNLASF